MSNDPTIGGNSWLVEFRDLPDSQCIYGSISKDQISDSADNAQATSSLAVGIRSTPQTCNYQITETNERPVKQLELRYLDYTCYYVNCDSEFRSVVANCNSTGKMQAGVRVDDAGFDRKFACYTLAKSSLAGRVDYSHISWNTKVSAVIGGVPYEDVISYGLDANGKETGQLQTYLPKGGSQVYASFAGNLLNPGFVQCPQGTNPQNVKAAQVDGAWQTTSANSYSVYAQLDPVGFNACLSVVNRGETPESCLGKYNSAALAALNPAKITIASQGINKVSVVDGNVVKLELVQPLLYPSLSMRIKADLLGVFVGVGEPEIKSVSSGCFQSSYNGQLSVVVRNKGTARGTFETRASCEAPIRILGSSIDSFDAGETKTISVPITGTAVSDQNPSCTVQVTDRASVKTTEPYKASTCIKGSGSGGCSPTGSTSCGGSDVYTCQATGQRTVTQTCPLGCKQTDTGAVCKTECVEGVDCPKSNTWKVVLVTLFAAVVLGAGVYFAYKKRRGY